MCSDSTVGVSVTAVQRCSQLHCAWEPGAGRAARVLGALSTLWSQAASHSHLTSHETRNARPLLSCDASGRGGLLGPG